MSRSAASSRVVVAQTQNLFKNSEDLTAATWGGSNATRTANSGTDPLGGSTANLLTAASSTGLHYCYTTTGLLGAPPVSPGAIATLSVYAKAGTVGWLYLFGNNGNASCYFNLSTGALGTAVAATGATSNAGGSWWRCSITYTPIAVSSGAAYIGMVTATANGSSSYADVGTGTLLLWGVQFVGANWPGPYVKTAASMIATPIRSVAATRTAAGARSAA